MRRVALIPARGGSKRLPRKNIAKFMGKPIIAWTILAARATKLFDEVVVSTEDPEIAKIAKKYRAKVDHRPKSLAGDKSTVGEVCMEFLKRKEKEGKNYDVLCVLYATAPLRTAKDIVATVKLIKPGICDFSVAVTHYALPPHQALKRGKGNTAKPQWPALVNKRSADIGELVIDNGSTYAASVSAFKKIKAFYGPKLKVHVMPRDRSQDIDEQVDLELARFFAVRNKQ